MGSLRKINNGQPIDDQPTTLTLISRLLGDADAALREDTQSAYLCLDQAMELLRREQTCAPRAGGLSTWQVRRLDLHIFQHLDSPIRTCELAALLQLSSGHFTRLCKQRFGISPRSYIARKRIEAAREMMQNTDEPLTRIAHAHGFCDQSHFCRTFRREIGISPRLWRLRQACSAT